MGKHDSSKTRVVPIFHNLHSRPEHFWVERLISLPIGGNHISLPPNCDFSIEDIGWGKNEKKLNPPLALLSWLIRNPRKPVSGVLSADPYKAQKRREWIDGSNKVIREGLALLRHNPKQENWHIFEGQTQPDVFIQTPDLIIVIEGKRTEKKPTTTTKWMANRHQMLRHIDCAWEIAGNRRVIGFFIVDGHDADCAVPINWINYAKQTISSEAIASSLPHRSLEEQKGIASCFAGVITWQRLCKEFCIDRSKLPDII